MFAKDYHGTPGPILTELAKQAERNYDLFFLCDADIPYADTWDRSGDQNRLCFQQQIIADLAERKILYFVLRGEVDCRVEQVNAILKCFQKYGNVLAIPR